MSLPKQLINLLGLLAVLAVIVVGVVAVALPLYTQSQSVDGQTAQVAQSNQLYNIKLQGLRAAKANLPQTEQQVAQLRQQITVQNRLDDAFEIAIEAAASTKSTITQMTAADVEPFAPRTTVGPDGKAAAPTAAPAPDPSASASPDAASTSTDSAASGTGAAGSGTTAASGTATTAAATGRMQAPFTITVTVPSPDAAARFLDGLRAGPRLIAVLHSTLSGGATAGSATTGTGTSYTLAVDALAFISPNQ